MPEEGLETQELREQLEASTEHAHGGGHGQAPSWMTSLSLSTALVAVLAAVASLESGSFANDAIVQKNEAVLQQSRAGDAWSFYQAKGIKAAIYAGQAELGDAHAEFAAHAKKTAERERSEQEDLKKVAAEHEEKVAEMNRESSHSLHAHHTFATAVTIFQVAIALSAIAALTRKKPMWWVSLAAGAAGVVFFVKGFAIG